MKIGGVRRARNPISQSELFDVTFERRGHQKVAEEGARGATLHLPGAFEVRAPLGSLVSANRGAVIA